MVVARDTTMVPPLPSELGRGRMAPLGRNVGVLQRGMRPAGVIGPARQVAPVGVLDVKRKSAVWPLSAEAVEFSPMMGHKIDVIAGQETVSSGAGGVAPAVVADVPPTPDDPILLSRTVTLAGCRPPCSSHGHPKRGVPPAMASSTILTKFREGTD